MKTTRTLLICAFAPALFASGLLAANPTFTGVVNPASDIPPGLPNYGIAQGSVFVVYGANLGPSSLAQASSLPLPTTAGLAGTSINITVNGTTVTAPMVYTVQFQVAAVLPSNTPVGTGTLTLTYNGASGTTPIAVVVSDFGILTLSQSGSGAGLVTNPDYSLVTNTNAAKPGDTLVIWGTGLGPISGSDAIAPVPGDLGTPIQVYIGGAPATVLYRGRSGDPGLDQINIVVPQGITSGCYVSLIVQTGNLVSNTVSLAIAPGGGPCSDSAVTTNIPGTAAGTYKVGAFSLGSSSETLALGGTITALNTVSAGADFFALTYARSVPAQTVAGAAVSLGNCSVISEQLGGSSGGGGTGTGATGITTAALNPGTLSLKPPAGSPAAMTSLGEGDFTSTLSQLSVGTYQFSNGTGGPDLGPFTVNLTLPPPLVWTNQSVAAGTIDRTQPLTLTWTGGDPNGLVAISLSSEMQNPATSTGALASVYCTAPASAGQFTIPPYAMLGLIPGSTTVTDIVSLEASSSQLITVPGLDQATVSWTEITTIGTGVFK